MRNYIKNIAIHYKGDYTLMRKHIAQRRPICDYEYSGDYLCIGDAEYPVCFYTLEEPPFIIFYKGNIDLLNTDCIAVVGSRMPSAYSLCETKKLVMACGSRYTIVSGLARGIDICAHRFARHTIAVVATGLDRCYPPEHAIEFKYLSTHHLVISEYPEGVWIKKHHFPFRNRLIACLGSTVYVMSARLRSGTMHTVNQALKLNREVKCLPHSLHEKSGAGCNLLIQEGATVLTNTEDLSNI